MTTMPESYKRMVAGKNGLEKKNLYRDLMNAFCQSSLELSQQEVKEVAELAMSEIFKKENGWNATIK